MTDVFMDDSNDMMDGASNAKAVKKLAVADAKTAIISHHVIISKDHQVGISTHFS